MALLMKESNEILSSVYRTTPTLFNRYMPSVAPTSLTNSFMQHQQTSPQSSSFNQPNESSPSLPSYDHHLTSSASTSPLASEFAPNSSPPLITTSPLLIQQTPKHLAPYTQTYLNSAENVCETAARILFMCVRWAKSIPAYVQLDIKDQLALLEDGWRENFLLSSAQFQMQLDLGPLLANAGLNSETCSQEKLVRIMTEMRNFQEIISKFKHAQVDATEFACLKAMTLFKTSI
jgi:hypothetical protein